MSNNPGMRDNGFRNLLIILLLYLFGSSLLSSYPSLAIIAHGLLSLTLFFSIYALQKRQNYRPVAMVLLVPVLVMYWLGLYGLTPFDLLIAYLLLALYFLLLIVAFAGQLLRIEQITLPVIFATLCLYLIIGLLWGSLYSLCYKISPGSFAGAMLENPGGSVLVTFNYFSIVTLTTLGYGDITPQTPAAAALCQLEAITGHFFTAVVVAWLVGNFVAEKRRTH